MLGGWEARPNHIQDLSLQGAGNEDTSALVGRSRQKMVWFPRQ